MEHQAQSNEEVRMDGFLRISVILSALQKNLERTKSDRVEPLNLKNGEVFIMYVLYCNPEGLSAEQLAQTCALDRSLISRSLPSLEKKGYIHFLDLPVNKRRYGSKIALTEDGWRVGGTVARWAQEIQAYLDEGIPPEHLEIMYATLHRLCDRFEMLNRETRHREEMAKDQLPE